MSYEKSKVVALEDKDLEQAYGGQVVSYKAQYNCGFYPPAKALTVCQNPQMGLCEECKNCRLME